MSKEQIIEPLLQQEVQQHHAASSVDAILRILGAAENGDIVRQAELFADMEERDAHIFAEMGKRKMAVSQLDWNLKAPEDAGSRERKEVKALEDWIRNEIDVEALVFGMSDGIGQGFSNVQIFWGRVGANKQWFPVDMKPRPARWFTVDQSTREEIRIRSSANAMDGEALIPFGWVSHKHQSKTGYPATQGVFRALALPYLFRNFAVKNWLRFCENYAVPIRVLFHHEKDQTRKRELRQALQAMGASGVALIEGGAGDDLKTVDTTKGEGNGFEMLMGWCERSISKAILGGTLTSDTGKNGNYATASIHDDIRIQIRNHDARQIQATLTRDLIGSIIKLNGLNIRARWLFDTQEPEDIKLYSEALPALVGIGARIPLAWAHEKLKIPKADDNEEVLSVRQQQAPREMAGLAALKGIKVVEKPKFTPQQQAVENLADALLENLESPINPALISSAIRGASSPEELESRLAAVLLDADLENFSEILEKALFAADVMGYAHA